MRSFVFAVGLTLLVVGIFTQPEPAQSTPITVTIHVDRQNNRMWFTPPHSVGLCGAVKRTQDEKMADDGKMVDKQKQFCEGDQIEWKFHALQLGETLTIDNASGHVPCFPAGNIPKVVTNNTGTPTDVDHLSGLPLNLCTWDPYGVYWPYVVELELANGNTIKSDPGGIIFP